MKITNISAGPRGVNSVGGPVLVEPGATIEAKVYAREKNSIEASGWFKTSGSFEDNPAMEEGKQALPDDVNAKIAKLTEQVSLLTSALSAAMSRSGPSEPAAAPSSGPVLVAKHAGGGSWFVYSGDEKLGDAMSKDDAEAFNALSDEEKAAFLKKE